MKHYTGTKTVKAVGDIQTSLLLAQHVCMNGYLDILELRIGNIEKEMAKDK